MFFSRKKISGGNNLKLYGSSSERVESFRFLGVVFDSKLTWREHVRNVEGRCKKVINIMRCLTGVDWGADTAVLKNIYTALI